MKINITIKAKNNLDPLTTSNSDIELEIAKSLEAIAVQMMVGTAKYARKAHMDKNGNTIGYDYTIIV